MRSVAWLLLLILLLGGAGCARGAGRRVSEVTPDGFDVPVAVTATAGLQAVAGGNGSVRVDWQRPPDGFEVVLYHATDPASVYNGSPVRTMLAGDHVVLRGFAPGVDHYFGLGVRPLPLPAEGPFETPVGVVLQARTDGVVYVDAGAPAGGADGKTPKTAFPSLGAALAATASPRTIWMRSGTYTTGALSFESGDQVFGGFGGAYGAPFDPAARELTTTIVQAGVVPVLFECPTGPASWVLDGLVLQGQPKAFVAISADTVGLELRSVVVRDFAGRGILLADTVLGEPIPLRLAGCQALSNGAEGLSGNGAYDIHVHGCRFVGNGQEGFDFNDLIAPEGKTASLEVTSCAFWGNGAEGMDIDMSAPVSPGTPSGRFDVKVRGSVFVRNDLDGLLLDAEYELAPLWSARMVVTECVARDNALAGVHVDADGIADVLVHRSALTANAGEGLSISSESQTGHVVLSSSAIVGNQGAGVRAWFGQKAIVASHCVFARNAGGGLRSEVVTSCATSCIAFDQTTPWTRVDRVGCLELPGTAAVFKNVARGVATVVARTAAQLTIAPGHDVRPGDLLELSGDGFGRRVLAVAGNLVTVDKAPRTLRLPASAAVFSASQIVREDYGLAPGSPAAGAGMQGRDAGPLGAPTAAVPGAVDAVSEPLFWPIQTSPAFTVPMPTGKNFVVAFAQPIDTSSATGQVRAIDANGAKLPISLFAVGDQILVFPPSSGWPQGSFRFEFGDAIRSADRTPLSTPFFLPMRTN